MDILCYSVFLDRVEKVSSPGGLALQAKDRKKIYFFGGFPNSSKKIVHKFDPITNVTVRLSTELPSSIIYAGGVSINRTILLFDGQNGNVIEFSEQTETASIIAELSFVNGTSDVDSIAALPDNKDGIWLFPGMYPKPTHPILQFNTTTKSVQTPNTNTTLLPRLYNYPAPVRDGSHGYIIGGIVRETEEVGSNGMLRLFCISVLEILLIKVYLNNKLILLHN
jgi:hypothetical protein